MKKTISQYNFLKDNESSSNHAFIQVHGQGGEFWVGPRKVTVSAKTMERMSSVYMPQG